MFLLCCNAGMPPLVESWNQRKPPYQSPVPTEVVRELMERAEAQLGRRCHHWPCMSEQQRNRHDGWVNVGSLGEQESGQAWQVWWHRTLEVGRLWPFVMLPNGAVQPRRFEP